MRAVDGYARSPALAGHTAAGVPASGAVVAAALVAVLDLLEMAEDPVAAQLTTG